MPRGNQKEPIDLVLAKGKKHLTKAEIKKRRDEEIHINAKNIIAPDYLNKKQEKEFIHIANILLDIGIMTELDENNLAQFLIANTNYILYTKKVNQLNTRLEKIKEDNVAELAVITEELDSFLKYQDKALSQSRACANDMGLTISSRCRLVVPQTKEVPKENKFAKFKTSGA